MGIFSSERFYTDYRGKNIDLLYHSCCILYDLYHFPLQTYIRSQSYLATLNSYNILRGSWGVYTFPLKLSTSLRTNHTKVCSLMKNSVSYGVKKIRLNPSIDPFIIFRGSL